MPKGSNITKGMRPGGRSKGTPNKVTVEAAEIARISNERARASGVKLGKDMLEDYMMAFHNQAVVFQPLPPGVSIPGRTPDPAKFMEWGRLVVDTAKELAKFQSPTFRAIAVVAPQAGQDKPAAPQVGGDNVITIKDAQALARVYQNMVRQVRG